MSRGLLQRVDQPTYKPDNSTLDLIAGFSDH